MRDMNLLKKYLKDISKYSLLNKDQEIELSKLIDQGDEIALKRMINSNLKLVVKIALEYYKGTCSIMDIIQNGNIGLMKAAKKFDHNRGVKFSTYGAFWIRQSILRGFIKPAHNINISYRKDTINKKIREYVREFQEEHEKYPTISSIMKEVGVSRRDAVDMIFYFKKSDTSLNEVLFEEGEEIIDGIPDEKYNPAKVCEENSMLDEIEGAVNSFSARESEIIKKRFGFDNYPKETLQNLGNRYSITAEAARQIEKRVLISLKKKYPCLSYYYYTG